MMISRAEIREIEDSSGISKVQLMENAGREAARIISEKYEAKNKNILIAAYHGNNGGDGFVAARHLSKISNVDVLFLGAENRFKEETDINFKRIENNPMIQFVSTDNVDFSDYDIIIDAILGIGIQGELKSSISNVIEGINKSSAKKVSLDIPTGLNPDTGEVSEKVVNADMIITFHQIKKGLSRLKDKTVVADIGIK